MWDPQDKAQEWVFGKVSDCPDLCQPTGSSLGQAGLWKRGMKAKLCCLLASGAGLSHSALDSLNTELLNPCPVSPWSLSLHAVLGGSMGGRNHEEFRGNAPLQAREVPGYQGTVPCGTESSQHMEGAQPWCRASPVPPDGNSSLDGAL